MVAVILATQKTALGLEKKLQLYTFMVLNIRGSATCYAEFGLPGLHAIVSNRMFWADNLSSIISVSGKGRFRTQTWLMLRSLLSLYA